MFAEIHATCSGILDATGACDMDTSSEDAIGFVPAGLAERPVWHVAHKSVEAVGVFKQMAESVLQIRVVQH